jgi:hypothetical protein
MFRPGAQNGSEFVSLQYTRSVAMALLLFGPRK